MAAQVHIVNLAEWLASLEAAKAYASDLTDPLHRIGRDWMRANKAYFRQSPGVYADLSNKGSSTQKIQGFGPKRTGTKTGEVGGYKLQKLRRWGFIYPILRASGALERSMTVMGDPNNLFEILNKETLILGTRAVSKSGANYPAFLNAGTRFTPKREFLTISELTAASWRSELKKFVGEAWGKPGEKPPAAPGKAPSKVGSPVSAIGESESGGGSAAAASGGGGGGGGGSSGGSSTDKKKKKKR